MDNNREKSGKRSENLRKSFGETKLIHISEVINFPNKDLELDINDSEKDLKEIDDITGAIHKSDLVLIASEPLIGKTETSLKMAAHISLKENLPAVFFSLKQFEEQIVNSIVDSRGTMFTSANIFIGSGYSLDIGKIKELSMTLKEANGLSAIFVDNLQLLGEDFDKQEKRKLITEQTKELKALAKELQVPVILIIQLEDLADKEQNKRPCLYHLHDIGDIEPHADIIFLIQREKRSLEVSLAKNRYGKTGKTLLY